MQKYMITGLCVVLLFGIIIPSSAAENIFDLLETPAPTYKPAQSHIPVNTADNETVEVDNILSALETPEPTPFPTPPPRPDSKSSKKSGDFVFLILSDGSAKIIAYKGSDKVLSIPAKLKEYPVSSIGVSAFADTKNLMEIMIPEGVTSIGEWAFGGCQKLEKVTLPESMITIGSFAFADCPALSTMNVPSGVIEIGTGVIERKSPGVVLTIQLEKGSYADHIFAAFDCLISYKNTTNSSPTSLPSYTIRAKPSSDTQMIYPDFDDDGDYDTFDIYGPWYEREYYDSSNASNKIKCHVCNGDKKCTECGGTGRITIQKQGINLGNGSSTYNEYRKCPLCDGDRKCYWCNGKGYEPYS